MADFMPLDVRVKMLEDTNKAMMHDEAMIEAYEIMDGITRRYTDAARVLEAIDAAGKDMDPATRQQLYKLGQQYRTSETAVIARERDSIKLAAGQLINQKVDPESMDPDLWEKLLPETQEALRAKFLRSMQGDGFGETDTMYSPAPAAGAGNHVLLDDGTILMGAESQKPSYSYWRSIPREQRPGVNLDAPEWQMAFTYRTWKSLVDEQEVIRKEIAAGKAPAADAPGMSNTAMVTSWLVRKGHIPQYGRETEESEAFQQLLYQMDRATQAEQGRLGRPLTNTERDKLLGEILLPTAFTDDWTFWPDMDEKDRLSISAMSSKQLTTARLTWAKAATDVASTSSAGISTTYKSTLELMAKRLTVEPDQEAYERAYFALKYGRRFGWGYAEVEERLKDE
jgi:hypothetical protein